MPAKIVVCGASGRMGQSIAAVAVETEGIEIIGGIVREEREGRGLAGYPKVTTPEGAGEMIAGADVVLDFSAPGLLTRLLDAQTPALAGKALVVGTTGLDTRLIERLEGLAAEVAILVAANFSMGINLLIELVEEAARVLSATDFDLEIVETHHRNKVDAPSGTALALGAAAARARGKELERSEERRVGKECRGRGEVESGEKKEREAG